MESYVVFAVIGLNVIVSLVAFRTLATPQAERFLFIPYQVAKGENVSGMFLSNFSHGSIGHLFMNMLTLFFFGPACVAKSSAVQFVFIYAAAGTGAILLIYFLQRQNPEYRCLGASGSVVGVIFATIVLDPGITVYFRMLIPIPGPLYALGYLLVSLYLMRSAPGGVSHEAHIGGAAAGFLAAGLLAPDGYGPLIRTVTHWFS